MSNTPAGRDPSLLAHHTDQPCPGWCQQPHGHRYRFGLHPSQPPTFHRLHRLDLTPTPASSWPLSLRLTQLETSQDPSGSARTLHAPTVSVDLPEFGIDLGPGFSRAVADLRDLADLCAAAAMRLEEATPPATESRAGR